MQYLREFDYAGLLLIVGGVVLLLLGFNFGESSWAQAKTIAGKARRVTPTLYQTCGHSALLCHTMRYDWIYQVVDLVHNFICPEPRMIRAAFFLASEHKVWLEVMPYLSCPCSCHRVRSSRRFE